MSKEAKNEIDLMLRQLGRRDGDALFDSGEQHLDADELNSYVANALPSPARVRYMEHLADCTRCRGLVAQLSAAQGPVVVEPAASVPAPSGFKQFLASLLSPMVLRYAVPALGVLVIMVVGFVVMRRELTGNSVAKLSPRESTNAAAPESPSSASAGLVDPTAKNAVEPAKASPPEGRISGDTSGPRPSAGAANEPAPVTTQPPAAQPLAASPVAESAPPAPKAVAVQQEEAKRADSETKSEVDAVRPAKADEGTVQRRDVQAKAAQQQKAPMTETPGPTVSNRAPEVGRFGGTTAGVADKTRRGQRDETADKTSPKDEGAKQQNEAAAETRSVAGRSFRKSGNVWIDTAYDSSRQTFSVRRGSEQYRALVADEPEIGRIAEQLDGEFIVVWKSRAYRIR